MVTFLHKKFIQASSNPLIILLKKYPNKSWFYKELSWNPNLTWDFIKNNLHLPWKWNAISMNSTITWDIIQANPCINWDWTGVSQNPNITYDIIRNNPNHPWNWKCVSQNKNITWDIVRENPTPIPIIDGIERKEAIVMINDVLYPNDENKNEWNWNYLNHNFEWSVFENNPNLPRFYRDLSANTSITIEIVRKNPGVWNYYLLSLNENIPFSVIREDPNLRSWITSIPNISWDIIKNNPEFSWDFYQISSNPNITQKIVKNNPEYPWYKCDPQSGNNNPWLCNPNMKWKDLVDESPENTLYDLSFNKFNYSEVVYKRRSGEIKRNRMRMCGCSFVNWY